MHYSEKYYNVLKEISNNIPDKTALRNASVLITGATGLIGSAVCDVLVSINRDQNLGMRLLFAGRNKEALVKLD